jgi:hypothetical protein
MPLQRRQVRYVRRFLCALLLASMWTLTQAGQCTQEIAKVDHALKKQYAPDITFWNLLGCQICLGSELRKDAVVTKAQVREISFWRNVAYMHDARKDDVTCMDSLKTPKKLLRMM